MTTEYVALHDNATAADAVAALKAIPTCWKALNTLFLIDQEERLTACHPAGAGCFSRRAMAGSRPGFRDAHPGERG